MVCYRVLISILCVFQFIDLGSVMALGNMDSDSPSTSVGGHIPKMEGVINTPIKSTVGVTANHTSSIVSQGLATLNAGPVGTPQTMTAAQVASLTGNATGVNPTTVTVVSASGSQPTKTIVVVPVSAAGSGDAQPAIKRIKTN